MLRSTEPIDHALAAPPGSDGALSPSGAYIVETASSLSQPPQLIVRSAPEGEVACRLLLEVVTPATRPRHLQLHPLPTADHLGADVTHLAGREFDLWMGRGLCQKLAPHKFRPEWRRSHLT